jgi:hypothetical protein
MEKRHNTTPDLATWPTRKSMVRHGLAMNLPWLAFVNVSFALMLLLRNVLFGDVDTLLGTTQHLALMVDTSMLGIIIISAALLIMAWRHIAGISIVLFICSLLWALCGYLFHHRAASSRMAHLRCAAFSRHDGALFLPSGLLAFVIPLWLSLPFRASP